jgi:hypothetical protein
VLEVHPDLVVVPLGVGPVEAGCEERGVPEESPSELDHHCEGREHLRIVVGEVDVGGAGVGVLDEVFAARDLADWVDALDGMSTPWTVVRSAADAAVDPQIVANHFVTTVEGPARSLSARRQPGPVRRNAAVAGPGTRAR